MKNSEQAPAFDKAADVMLENPVDATDEQIAELSLLLLAQQVAELEEVAYSLELSLGQLIRLILRQGILTMGHSGPGNNPEP
jgi:hypothetical protein